MGGCVARDSAKVGQGARIPPAASAYRRAAGIALSRMTLEEKCGQVLLIGVPGKGDPSAETTGLVKRLGPGGILIFGFNVGDRALDLGRFTGGLQDAAAASDAGLPLIVAIDHEGGRVFRFKSGVTRLPSAAVVGKRGAACARMLGERAGLELAALGINLALAPVVELRSPGNAAFLGDRSYGDDPRLVDAVAGAFIEGLESSGVAAAAKHFPGNAGEDPHRGLPTLAVTRDALMRDYVARFSSAMDHDAAAVLLSHVLVPAIDPERPATISPLLDRDLLKTRMRFDGVVITDDLFMRALADAMPPDISAVEALAAGADLLMLSDGAAGPRVRDSIRRAAEDGALPIARLDDAVLRIIELKLRFSMSAAFDREARAARLASLPEIVVASEKAIKAARP